MDEFFCRYCGARIVYNHRDYPDGCLLVTARLGSMTTIYVACEEHAAIYRDRLYQAMERRQLRFGEVE